MIPMPNDYPRNNPYQLVFDIKFCLFCCRNLRWVSRHTNARAKFRDIQNKLRWHNRVSILENSENVDVLGGEDIHMEWKFVDVKLHETDKPKLEEYIKSHNSDYEAILQEILASGYKLSISWVDKQNSYCITMSGTKWSKRNLGYSVSSWSDDIFEAIAMSGYKEFVLSDGKEWSTLDSSGSRWE